MWLVLARRVFDHLNENFSAFIYGKSQFSLQKVVKRSPRFRLKKLKVLGLEEPALKDEDILFIN